MTRSFIIETLILGAFVIAVIVGLWVVSGA